jgi:hypothetical protein
MAAAECPFDDWMTYRDTRVLRHASEAAYVFSPAHLAIDADGAPNAYHPDDTGLDFLANAGYPAQRWWDSVLVADPEDPDRAYVQRSGPYAGYFVSKTSLVDRDKSELDPARYVDATVIPYLVFPGRFFSVSGTGLLGDLGFAINLGSREETAFVVADIGPSGAELGEISIALAERLGGRDVNPRTGAGAPGDRILYAVFPYSARTHRWPMTVDDLERHARELLGQVGGLEALLTCEKAVLTDDGEP